MFDASAGQGFSTASRTLGAVAQGIRATWVRVPIGLLALGVGAAGLWSSWALLAAGPSPCMELQHAEFTTIQELVDTKDKVLAYERDPEGELVLTGKEASFVLADNLKYPVWIETRADELFVQFALPEQERCYNIEFTGQVSVDEGVAHVVPSQLRVGRLDLSPFVAGRPLDASADDLEGPEARQLLTKTRHLRVENNLVHVKVDDPRSLRQ